MGAGEVVQRIGEIQRPLPAGTSLGIGLAALVTVSFPLTWLFVRYFDTMAHEGSHAVMRSVQGSRIIGVWLYWKGADGATASVPRGRGILAIFIGYLFGILAIGITGLVIYDFARYGTAAHATIAAYGIAWLLLLSGVRVVLEHWDGAGDAQALEGQTQIMAVTFARIWLVGAIFALLLGTRLMM